MITADETGTCSLVSGLVLQIFNTSSINEPRFTGNPYLVFPAMCLPPTSVLRQKCHSPRFVYSRPDPKAIK